MAEWRTPQMVHAIGGVTKEMVDAFNEYLGGVHPVTSTGGSNGAADTLTNWDGSEVTNGWRAPSRPDFTKYTRKKKWCWILVDMFRQLIWQNTFLAK